MRETPVQLTPRSSSDRSLRATQHHDYEALLTHLSLLCSLRPCGIAATTTTSARLPAPLADTTCGAAGAQCPGATCIVGGPTHAPVARRFVLRGGSYTGHVSFGSPSPGVHAQRDAPGPAPTLARHVAAPNSGC